MAKICKKCADGTWDCGEANEVCNPSGGWEKLGTICFDVLHLHDPDGDCRVKIVMPTYEEVSDTAVLAAATRYVREHFPEMHHTAHVHVVFDDAFDGINRTSTRGASRAT